MEKKFLFLSLITLVLYSCSHNEKKPDAAIPLTEQELVDAYFERKDLLEHIAETSFQTLGTRLEDAAPIKDTALIVRFLADYADSLEWISSTQVSPQDLIRHFYSIDLNNDGLPDLAYQGPSGGEPTVLHFFLQDSIEFKRIFTGYQKITSLTFSEDKLAYFTLANPGCCADPQILEYTYSVSFTESIPSFQKIKTTGYLRSTELVKDQFSHPKSFLVKKDNARLRSESIEFEGIENPARGNNGNIIGLYKKGSYGTALGSKQDSTGLWYFVLMDAWNKPDSCDFQTFLEQPTHIYGWIKKEDILEQ